MYKVIYFQYGTQYVDTINDLSELFNYREATEECIMWYDCTVDANNIVADTGFNSSWTVGEIYDEDLSEE